MRPGKNAGRNEEFVKKIKSYLRVNFKREGGREREPICTVDRLFDGIKHVQIASIATRWHQGMSRRQNGKTQEHEGTDQHR